MPVSGSPRDVSLWAFGPTEGSSDLMTGGDSGTEGGLVALGVWVVITLVSFVHLRRAQTARSGTVVPSPAYDDRSSAPA